MELDYSLDQLQWEGTYARKVEEEPSLLPTEHLHLDGKHLAYVEVYFVTVLVVD